MKTTKILCVAALLAISFSNSVSFGVGVEPRKKKQTREAFRAELDSLIKENKVACKFSMDCEALALGSKPCGGPTEYVILSKATRAKISSAVTDLIKTIDELDQTHNAETGAMGTCMALEKPPLTCKAGTCSATP